MRKIVILTILLLAVEFGHGQEAVQKASLQLKSISLPSISATLKDGEGRVDTESYCNICHSVDYIPMQPKLTKAQWTASVNKMIKAFGAPIDEKTAQEIAQYLAANYGAGK